MSTRGITTTIAVILAIVTLLVGLVVGILVYPVIYPPEEAPPAGLTGEIKLGALLSLTGRLATFGENEQLAAEFAAEHVNDLLEDMGANWTLTIEPEDTGTDPDTCLTKVESFAARGITLLIGPLSSAEVTAIKTYCDSNKILAISQSSTAPDLAIVDDYIFRFCPTDKLGQGPAVARVMYDDGIRYIIPVTVNDAWGVGLEEAAEVRYEALGGTFLPGIRYAPETTEFSTEAADLKSKVDSALADPDIDETNLAVWYIAFEEVVAFFTAVDDYPVLSTVKWYGSDGTAGSSAMFDDQAVIDFAVTVEFPNTIFAPTESDKFETLRQHGWDELERELDSYSYAIYDVVWAYALCLLTVDEYDAEAVKEVLPTVTELMFGASGWITLDEAGDRMAGDYDVWQIVQNATDPTDYYWEITGKYILAADAVEWY